MGVVVSICSAGNDSFLCQIFRKLGIPDFERGWLKRILPVLRLQPGLDKALQNHALQLKAWAMGSRQRCSVPSRNCSLVHAAARWVTLLGTPALGGCYTHPRSQLEPKWHPAPWSDMMPQPLGQEGSELQLAEGWGLLHAHPIPTLLPRPQGGPQPPQEVGTNLHNPSLSPAAPATFRKTQKQASQSKLCLLPSVRVSRALLTKVTFGFLESRCAKPYQRLLLPARLLALMWVWAVLFVHIWSATHSLWFLLIE